MLLLFFFRIFITNPSAMCQLDYRQPLYLWEVQIILNLKENHHVLSPERKMICRRNASFIIKYKQVLFVCLFVLLLLSQVNSYGHGGTVSSPNRTFFPGQA